MEDKHGSKELIALSFPDGKYNDVPGLCKVATKVEIEEKGWVLSPGRYIDIIEDGTSDEDFNKKLGELTSKLGEMFTESEVLEKKIKENLKKVGF